MRLRGRAACVSVWLGWLTSASSVILRLQLHVLHLRMLLWRMLVMLVLVLLHLPIMLVLLAVVMVVQIKAPPYLVRSEARVQSDGAGASKTGMLTGTAASPP